MEIQRAKVNALLEPSKIQVSSNKNLSCLKTTKQIAVLKIRKKLSVRSLKVDILGGTELDS